jgi:hypothetical protein
MFSAASFISLSNLFEAASINADPLDPLPIYVPVMCSFSMPLICSTMMMFTKYVTGTKKMLCLDFSFGYTLVAKGLFVIVSLVYF